MSSLDANTKRAVADKGVSMVYSTPTGADPATAKQHPPSRRGVLVNLVVDNADSVVQHLGKATGAREYFRAPDDKGKILHLALDVDDVAMYVEEIGHCMYNGSDQAHVRLQLTMDEPEKTSEKLIEAGAKTLNKMEKQFWGAIYGVYEDPFGVVWSVSNSSTNKLEDVPKELQSKLVPFIMVNDATAYLKFLKDVFGAEPVTEPAKRPGGKIMWAYLNINGGKLAVADQCEGVDGSTTITYQVPAGQADAVCKAFEADGGKILEAPSMQFWGQVWGRCKDASGQSWGILEPETGPTPSKEEMEVEMRLREKYNWKWSWKMEDLPTMYCFGEVRTTAAQLDKLCVTMEEMMPRAHEEAAKRGLQSVGHPCSGYFTWDSNGQTRLTTGRMVAEPSESSGEQLGNGSADAGFAVRALGGVKCATVVYTGPYSNIMTAYHALYDWIAAKGYESGKPSVEIYENTPKDTEESKLRTKICMPVSPKNST